MNDQHLIAEAYQNLILNEGLDTKSIINKALDIIEQKFPSLYQKLISAQSAEALQEIVGQPQTQEGVLSKAGELLRRLNDVTNDLQALSILNILLGVTHIGISQDVKGLATGTFTAAVGMFGLLYAALQERKKKESPMDRVNVKREALPGKGNRPADPTKRF